MVTRALYTVLTLLAAGSLSLGPVLGGVLPESETTPFNNEKYEENADWILTLSAREIKEYLIFNRSPISPVVCVSVKSQVRNETGSGWKEKRLYETLWYHSGQPIGLRRFEKLALGEDTHGVIKIESGVESSQQTKSLINAALRLLPDIYHLKAIPIVIVLPRDVCNNAESDLSAMRFYRVRATTGDATALVLHVVSLPSGYDRYFYYSIRGGEILE